jgi:hypothetical protein
MRTAVGEMARAGNENLGAERDNGRNRRRDLSRSPPSTACPRTAPGPSQATARPLLAVADEAYALLPPDALRWWDPEPGPLEPASRALSGIEDELRLVDWVDILNRNLEWARRMSRTWVVTALGPCYLLSTTLEHPTYEAAQLRTGLEQARDELQEVLLPTFTAAIGVPARRMASVDLDTGWTTPTWTLTRMKHACAIR